MNYLSGSMTALGQTLLNFFRPVVTEGVRLQDTRAERYKSSFALVHEENGDEACIGCMKCEVVCPSDVITVVKAPMAVSPNTGKKRLWCEDFTLDLQACIYCELCVQVCPTDAIVMVRVVHAPAFDREDLVLTMGKLYQNETIGVLSWGKGSVLTAMQDPKRGQPKKVPSATSKETP